jgi:hypothetical protein
MVERRLIKMRKALYRLRANSYRFRAFADPSHRKLKVEVTNMEKLLFKLKEVIGLTTSRKCHPMRYERPTSILGNP